MLNVLMLQRLGEDEVVNTVGHQCVSWLSYINN